MTVQPRIFVSLCVFVMCTLVIYLFTLRSNFMIIDSIKIPFWFSENFSIVNLSTKIHQFQSRNYDYYPHLPIHIFTQNLSLISNISTSKIILLGNGFFGNAYWHFALPNRSSSEKSKTY